MSAASTLSMPLNLMAVDAVRAKTAQGAGERVVAIASQVADLHLGQKLWNFLSVIGEARARTALMAMASDEAASRPEFAASLRRAARRSWMD